MSKIPQYILCKDAELARQVLEKIERESDLRWYFTNESPSDGFIKHSQLYPMFICCTENITYISSHDTSRHKITNFTKAEDFLNNNYMTEKTWENLQEGWVLEHSRDEFEILAIRGRVIDLSSSNDFNLAGGRYTKEELINGGFKIKGASEDKPSIDDVIAKLSVSPVTYNGSLTELINEAIEMLKKLKS